MKSLPASVVVGIVADAAIQRVGAGGAAVGQNIIAIAARKRVAAVLTVHVVVAAKPLQHVAAAAAIERVPVRATRHGVRARTTAELKDFEPAEGRAVGKGVGPRLEVEGHAAGCCAEA